MPKRRTPRQTTRQRYLACQRGHEVTCHCNCFGALHGEDHSILLDAEDAMRAAGRKLNRKTYVEIYNALKAGWRPALWQERRL